MKVFLLLPLVLLVGCSARPQFLYKHYGLAAQSYEGKLLASTEAGDLPLSLCAPDDKSQGKCIIMLRDEFYSMKEDYLGTKLRVIELEKKHD